MSFDIESELGRTRVMVVIRNETPERTVELCAQAWDLGVTAVEVPIQTLDYVPSLAAAVAAGRERGMSVGAGSVHTLEQWDAATGAGAVFTVAAATSVPVIERARERGVPHIPGVATPTEVATALAAGATWLKAFPASLLTPAWISAVRAPFPQANFVVTGGVGAKNAQAFLDAGVRAVAFGSSFAEPESAAAIRGILAAS